MLPMDASHGQCCVSPGQCWWKPVMDNAGGSDRHALEMGTCVVIVWWHLHPLADTTCLATQQTMPS